MIMALSHYEYDRAGNKRRVEDQSITINKDTVLGLTRAAKQYRTTKAGMIELVLAYYFGDCSNHLGCADCMFDFEDMGLMEPGTQTTLPLLDKGSVVVGKPSNDLGV